MTEHDQRFIDELYADRNIVVLGFASLARMRGWTVGWVLDEKDPEWGVIYIDTISGQVSWHYHREREKHFETLFDRYPRRWDGHTKALAAERMVDAARIAALKAGKR